MAAKYKAHKVKLFLDRSPDHIPTLYVLEKEFSLSKGHLQSGFQELFGMTIGGYSKTLKLSHIKELLQDYTLTLDSIAIQTGYNGSEALCRFFKMMEGVSPGAWRRRGKDFAE